MKYIITHIRATRSSQWGSSDELQFLQDAAVPYFMLPVRAWLDSHFTVRWTGRRGLTERPLWSPIWPHVIYLFLFAAFNKMESLPTKTKNTRWTEQHIRDTWHSLSSFTKEKFWTLRLPGCRTVWKMLGSMLESNSKWSCSGFKMEPEL